MRCFLNAERSKLYKVRRGNIQFCLKDSANKIEQSIILNPQYCGEGMIVMLYDGSKLGPSMPITLHSIC